MLKIREELIREEKHSYSMDEFVLPADGLDCSEGCNPYGFPNSVVETIRNFDYSKLSLYPHSQSAYTGVIKFWEGYTPLSKDNIILVDGSDFVMYNINSLFNNKGAKVLGFAPQYTDYVANIIMSGMEYVHCDLSQDENFKLDTDKLFDMLTCKYSILYIDNPNNPTGQTFSLAEIEKLIQKSAALDVCVVVDEAYGDFMTKDQSAVNLISKYDNLLVMRTLSKGFGLAGLRAGYAVGSKLIIDCMQKMTNPYVICEMTREIMGKVLTCENDISSHMLAFTAAKRKLRSVMGENLHMAHTDDNVSICLIYHSDKDVDLLQEFLKKGVLAVPGDEFIGIGKNTVRLRIPKKEDMEKLLFVTSQINRGL